MAGGCYSPVFRGFWAVGWLFACGRPRYPRAVGWCRSTGAVPAPWSDVRLSVVLRTGDAHRGFKQRWFAVGSSLAFQGGIAMALS